MSDSDATLPTANEHGVFPEGIHEGSVEEIEERLGRFQRSDRRPHLMQKLKEYLQEIRRAGFVESVIVDGSFAMPCVDEPSDIDLIVILPADWDFTQPVRPVWYNLLSRKRVRKRYGFDVAVVPDGSEELTKWTHFFVGIREEWYRILDIPVGTRKGLVRVKP